jgi:hypothetical protein
MPFEDSMLAGVMAAICCSIVCGSSPGRRLNVTRYRSPPANAAGPIIRRKNRVMKPVRVIGDLPASRVMSAAGRRSSPTAAFAISHAAPSLSVDSELRTFQFVRLPGRTICVAGHRTISRTSIPLASQGSWALPTFKAGSVLMSKDLPQKRI